VTRLCRTLALETTHTENGNGHGVLPVKGILHDNTKSCVVTVRF